MTRRIPVDPPANIRIPSAPQDYRAGWQPDPARPGNVRRDIQIEVITPMFGGGATAREIDPEMPVSAKAIRGHLRFWWRVMCGGGYASAESLYEAESRLFGSVEGRSPVEVAVEVTKTGTSICASTLSATSSPLRYVLFPFLADHSDCVARKGCQFRLRVSCPKEIQLDVDCALWTWLTFDGIGARTRRGCGALYSEAYPFTPAAPRLPKGSELWLGPSVDDAVEAWNTAVALLRDFRQCRRASSGPKDTLRIDGNDRVFIKPTKPHESPPPGRSLWPEPDSLREITGCWLKSDLSRATPPAGYTQREHTPSHPDSISFPRAVFGLPIIFHFADAPSRATRHRTVEIPDDARDPEDVTLLPALLDSKGRPVLDLGRNPKHLERMASPVILRPIRSGNKYCPAFLFLDDAHIKTLHCVLSGKKIADKHRLVGDTKIRYPAGAKDTEGLMQGHCSALDALRAVLQSQQYNKMSSGSGTGAGAESR